MTCATCGERAIEDHQYGVLITCQHAEGAEKVNGKLIVKWREPTGAKKRKP